MPPVLAVSPSAHRDEQQAWSLAERALARPGQRGNHRPTSRPVAAPASFDKSVFGTAQPLDAATRGDFEDRFGHDFREVRVYADARANAAAESLQARAFALGNDIVFAAGEYAPATASGRRLLAHELAHTTQPHAGVIHREPGVNARESWNEVVPVVNLPVEEEKHRRAVEAIDRFLESREGASLINTLWHLVRGPHRRFRSAVTMSFIDDLSHITSHAEGFFEPDIPGEPAYTVLVKNNTQPPLTEDERARTLPTAYPSQRYVRFTFEYRDAESQMAATIHHELTHVWFVNTHQGAGYPTGHGTDVEAGQVEDAFSDRLQAFAADMDALEARMRREAEERRQEEQRRREAEERSREARPDPPRRPEPQPRLLGVQGFAQGGIASAGETRGTVILGADLILDRIASFHLGARGVYLSPNHLFAGGTIGLRWLQDTDEIRGQVENPLFFDIEAGVLAEVEPRDATRLTRSIAGFGSATIGQEYGRSGTRFFWNIGGFAIITDRGEWDGGGIGGVGFRH